MNIDDVEIVEYTEGDRRARLFVVDGAMQSATYIDKEMRNELNFEYMRCFAELSKLHEKCESVLMIGAGMFSYPKYLISHDPVVRVDAVDPDEDMFDYACAYFYLDELIHDYDLENSERLRFMETDGRSWLSECGLKYDIIINDAFDGFEPAINLCTKEASCLIHDHLNEGGMYLCNVPGYNEEDESLFLKGVMKTLSEEFRYVSALKAKKGSYKGSSMNYIVLASDAIDRCPDAVEIDLSDAPVFEDTDHEGIYDTIDWF